MPIGIPPRSQGLSSSTFVQPPFDLSLSIPALYDWQYKHSANNPLFVFEEATGQKRTITWGEATPAFHRATRYVRDAVRYSGEGKKPFIAILATTEFLSYFALMVGALRTGWTLFPISPRNSPQAVAHLLQKTGVTHLFISAEASVQQLADDALRQLESINVEKLPMPTYDALYTPKTGVLEFEHEPFGEFSMDDDAIVIHSSGTTSYPKPIYSTHRQITVACYFPCWGETDLADNTFSMLGIPLFHGMGLFGVLFSVTCGFKMAIFTPQYPPTIPTSQNVLESCVKLGCDYAFITPAFAESWAQEPKYVRALAKMKGVAYGGGPLSKAAGDYLVSQGVNIFCLYGSTEAVVITVFLPKPQGMDWEYIRISPTRDARFIDRGDNEFQLIVLENENFSPNVINWEQDGRKGYDTSDLLSPHPTKPNYWKIVGRTDDQIMHSTGEKTNPGPLEVILLNDPFVHGAVIFGRGRFHAGVLIQPNAPFEFDPRDTQKLINFRNLIWPTIERMNAFAPTHSRIFKEMILITSPEKPLLFTAKGTVRRKPVLEQYAEDIDALYAAVDESAQEDIPAPVDWSFDNTQEFVGQVVQRTMKANVRELSGSSDLFEVGLDSLQATWIRNTILRALRNIHPSTARDLPSTFVYDHSSLASLAKFISERVNGKSVTTTIPEDKRQVLFDLVEKYSTAFPQFKPSINERAHGGGDVVLLTGSSGSLGSNILAKLLEDNGVHLVYCISRPFNNGISVEEKHWKAFNREGLDQELLKSDKARLLEGDPSLPKFGLDPFVYEELLASVTHIVHNGWRVNFDLAVASFESNIHSVRNFVDFALTSRSGSTPARIIFISSIGVFSRYIGPSPAPEEYLAEPDSALGLGYSESKWVSEHILRTASSQQTALSTTVMRCGQMTGGPSGAWNTHEWFPSLLKSSIKMGKIPAIEGDVSWITAYDAAATIVDALHSSEPVLHVVNSRSTPWNTLISAFACKLGLKMVSYTDWFAALGEAHDALYAQVEAPPESSEPVAPQAEPDLGSANSTADISEAALEKALRENPALRLFEFFRVGLAYEHGSKETNADEKHHDLDSDSEREPLGMVRIGCAKAVKVSPHLSDAAEVLGEMHVGRWLDAWKRSGFIE